LLEKIPGYSAIPNKSHNELTAQKTAAVDLAAVTFYPSHFLWYTQLAIYIAMLVFSFIALLPFFLTAFYWPSACYWIGAWLVFSLIIGFAINKAWRTKNILPNRLDVTQKQWRLTTHDGEFWVNLDGDVLLWSWLIIIPTRETLTKKAHYLIALPDSMSKEDWRRLSVWLKLG